MNPESTTTPHQAGVAPVKLILLIVIMILVAILAFRGWQVLHKNLLERVPPVVTSLTEPTALGRDGIQLKFDVIDKGAGLDEIVIRYRQRRVTDELLRQSGNAKQQLSITAELNPSNLKLEEGLVEVELRAFDRSFWSNGVEWRDSFLIDYTPPYLEVLSTQHNAHLGGSQLVLYRLQEEHLLHSGVMVGEQLFYGYPAEVLDHTLTDKNLFATLYALPVAATSTKKTIGAIAVDRADNQYFRSFYNKLLPRSYRTNTIVLNEVPTMDRFTQLPKSSQASTSPIKQFETLSTQYNIEDTELHKICHRSKHNNFPKGVFNRQGGLVRASFGDRQTFRVGNTNLGSLRMSGYRYALAERNVISTQSAIVHATGSFPLRGQYLVLDHGLGLMSVYSPLETIFVEPGEIVGAGQSIGTIGVDPLTAKRELVFELRVSGVPVDAREWWDKRWLAGHITGKLQNLKKTLGYKVTETPGNLNH